MSDFGFAMSDVGCGMSEGEAGSDAAVTSCVRVGFVGAWVRVVVAADSCALVTPRSRVGFVLGSGGFSGVGGAMHASWPLTAPHPLADSGTSPRFAGRGGAHAVMMRGVKLAMR